MAFDDTVPLPRLLLRIAEFFRDESCGRCVPCRIGTVRQEEALHRIVARTGAGAAGWLKEYEAEPDRFGPDAARLDEEPRVDNELYVRDYDKCILRYGCVDACGDQWQNGSRSPSPGGASTPGSPSSAMPR